MECPFVQFVNSHWVAVNIGRSFVLSLLFAATIINPTLCLAQTNLVERPKRELLANIKIDNLSLHNRELAEQLEIWPMLRELFDKQTRPSRERAIVLRQKIRETIFECYFDAESVQAEAHREIGLLEAKRETLVSKRDHQIAINNATNFIASGTLNTVGSALGFTNAIQPFPGNLNQMLAGVVSAAMSTYSLRQGRGGKFQGQGQPTIVAELFGRPCDEHTAYPESVWRFLHGTSGEETDKTRTQLLEARWILRNHLERHGSHREQLKLDLVSGMANSKKCMTLDDLNDQITMIEDIDAMVSLMSHHLRDLLSMVDLDVLEVELAP
jgi:hypothetical protein